MYLNIVLLLFSVCLDRMKIMKDDVVVPAESVEVVPDPVFTKEIAGLIEQNATVANIQTIGMVTAISFMMGKLGISFADFANRAQMVQDLLDSPEGKEATMLQLIMAICEKTKTRIEKA